MHRRWRRLLRSRAAAQNRATESGGPPRRYQFVLSWVGGAGGRVEEYIQLATRSTSEPAERIWVATKHECAFLVRGCLGCFRLAGNSPRSAENTGIQYPY